MQMSVLWFQFYQRISLKIFRFLIHEAYLEFFLLVDNSIQVLAVDADDPADLPLIRIDLFSRIVVQDYPSFTVRSYRLSIINIISLIVTRFSGETSCLPL